MNRQRQSLRQTSFSHSELRLTHTSDLQGGSQEYVLAPSSQVDAPSRCDLRCVSCYLLLSVPSSL